MKQKAFPAYYPDDVSHCYGCGRVNGHGLQIKSRWDDEETVGHVTLRNITLQFPVLSAGEIIASPLYVRL